VMVTASTGIAAANLSGHTMHSSVGLGINQTHLPKHIENPGDELLAQWNPVLCVVADELSMTDIAMFGLWEEALRKVKDNQQPFGGLIAVFMFDFCQLLTVRGVPIFKSPNPNKPFSPLQERGSRLYKVVEKVVYLTKNMRFASDPEWGDWLASARLGKWVPEMRDFIRDAPPPPAGELSGKFVQVISTDNLTRQRVNDSASRIANLVFGGSRKVYAIPARLPSALTHSEQARIRDLPDSQTGNIPVYLKAYIGACVGLRTCDGLKCDQPCGARTVRYRRNASTSQIQSVHSERSRERCERRNLPH